MLKIFKRRLSVVFKSESGSKKTSTTLLSLLVFPYLKPSLGASLSGSTFPVLLQLFPLLPPPPALPLDRLHFQPPAIRDLHFLMSCEGS